MSELFWGLSFPWHGREADGADTVGIAEPSQLIIDELAPALRVQDQDRERERQMAQDHGEGSEDNNLSTAGDGDDLRLSGTAVRDVVWCKVSCHLLSVMAHKVHLHGAGRGS
jgi:hypothetical protein